MPRIVSPLVRSLSLILTVTVVAACGSKDPKEALLSAQAALQSEDYDAALPDLELVVGADSATEAQKYQAQRDLVLCKFHVDGETEAIQAFKTLSRDHASRLNLDTLIKVGRDVAMAGGPSVAIEIVAVATKKYAKTEADKNELEKLALKIVSLGATDDDQEKLKKRARQLGYIGDGD